MSDYALSQLVFVDNIETHLPWNHVAISAECCYEKAFVDHGMLVDHEIHFLL